MKKTIAISVLMIFSLYMLSGCGLGKEYIIITDDTYAPFSSVDLSGNPVGFEIDLLELISKSENIKIQIIPIGLMDGFEALRDGSASAFMAALMPTDEFNEEFDFSDAYYGDFALAVKKGENAELLTKFNTGLKKIKENGKYDKLVETYMLGAENE